jgi:4-amino-4-deoxy-L-arabinose transferase-like glycosyltransferase
MKKRVLLAVLCVLCFAGFSFYSFAADKSGKYILQIRPKKNTAGELPYIKLSKTGYFSIYSGSIGMVCGYALKGNKITLYNIKGTNIGKETLDTKRRLGTGHFEGNILVLDSPPKPFRGGRFEKQ